MASLLPDPARCTISNPTKPRVGGFDASKTWARDTATNRRHILGVTRASVNTSRRSKIPRLLGPGRNVPRPPRWFILATSQSAVGVPGDGVTSSSVLARRVSKADGSECISEMHLPEKARALHSPSVRPSQVSLAVDHGVILAGEESRDCGGERLGAFPGLSFPPLPTFQLPSCRLPWTFSTPWTCDAHDSDLFRDPRRTDRLTLTGRGEPIQQPWRFP